MTDGQSEACSANAVAVDVLQNIEYFDEGRWLPVTLAARGRDFYVVRFSNDALRIVQGREVGLLLRNSPVRRYKRWLALCTDGFVAVGKSDTDAKEKALRWNGCVSGECRIVAVREIEWTDEGRKEQCQ